MNPRTVQEFAKLPFIQRAIQNPNSPKSVLSFFLGVDFEKSDTISSLTKGDDEDVSRMLPLWFAMGNKEFDELCTSFVDVIRTSGKRKSFTKEEESCWVSNDGKMAQIILCDQLARNAFRGSDEAYAYGDVALEYANDLGSYVLGGGSLPPCYVMLCILPLMHSESLKEHELCVELCQWGIESKSSLNFSRQMKWEIDHQEVIERFGRYPHRNESLGRQSTEEELKYLADKENLSVWAGGKKVPP